RSQYCDSNRSSFVCAEKTISDRFSGVFLLHAAFSEGRLRRGGRTRPLHRPCCGRAVGTHVSGNVKRTGHDGRRRRDVPPRAGWEADMSRVTVRDVAERAGVSISTVSRVLKGNAPVCKELHRRVGKAIEERCYRINALARGLRIRMTAVLRLIVPDSCNQYLRRLAQVIVQTAHEQVQSYAVCKSENSRKRQIKSVALMISQR